MTKKSNILKALVASLAIATTCSVSSVFAAELKPNFSNSSSEQEVSVVGKQNFLELDAQYGSFAGFRLKVFVASGNSYHLAIEGMAGGSGFANSGLFPATYGVGVRSEYYLASGVSHAWMLSPGLDGYYVPANPYRPSDNTQDIGQALGQALATAFTDVPTRVVLLSPNVDVTWTIQMAQHLSFVVGAKLGAVIALNGTTSAGENLVGKVTPDVGLFIGTRF